METVVILTALLVICIIAFVPVILKRPKTVADLEDENAMLKEILQNRNDTIDELLDQLGKENNHDQVQH